MLLYSSI